jgi:hypothetical protein
MFYSISTSPNQFLPDLGIGLVVFGADWVYILKDWYILYIISIAVQVLFDFSFTSKSARLYSEYTHLH